MHINPLRLTAAAALAAALSLPLSAQTAPPQAPAPPPHGKVLFNTDNDSLPAAEKPASPATPVIDIPDAERSSLLFTAYDLDVHLTPASSQIAVHARFTVLNTGDQPLTRLALQLSSTLRWGSFALQTPTRSQPLTFTAQVIDTDADHTGKASEAIVTLPQPLAPGSSLNLAAFYDGQIALSAQRLERIGAPAVQAAAADWDSISPDRTALRGFGNVLWYPVASPPLFLGDGAKLFQAVGRTKLLESSATIRLSLTIQYTGDPPDTVFFCGIPQKPVTVSENPNVVVPEAPGLATARFPARPLGFRMPSLFVTSQAPTTTEGDLISAVTDHYDALPAWALAASKVQPLLKDWLGPSPLTVLHVLDLDGQPFEDDALLVMPMHAADVPTLSSPLTHSLSHAWFRSTHVWLNEGVPQFMGLLWIEQSKGREAAIAQLDQQLNILAVAEPAFKKSETTALPAINSGSSSSSSAPAEISPAGQSLIEARDEIYYRTKAAAVLWMLRSIAGEDALKHTLQLYRLDEKGDPDPHHFQQILERESHKDLAWFFNDWVYQDRGLPDLSITSVTPRQLEAKATGTSWLVAVEVRNDGDAVAEVPVTVRSGTLTVTQPLRIPARSSASTRIVFQGVPSEVIVNDGTVPEMTTPTHIRQIAPADSQPASSPSP